MMNLTPAVRWYFIKMARRMDAWSNPDRCRDLQLSQLRRLLRSAENTETGRKFDFAALSKTPDSRLTEAYAESLPVSEYEDIRPLTLRMVRGEKSLLWPGACTSFAQSSGTSGGKSKYIPITDTSLKVNHFAGASDAVACYLRLNPSSRLFSGKALILGGSFANELNPSEVPPGVRVGDLSATLIDKAPWIAAHMRTPSRELALMADWEQKLPLMVSTVAREPVTSLSGVPSWFLILLRRVMAEKGVENLHEVWPGLEVFFHGGISFAPYRAEYESFTDSSRMHFLETYNASEGFFAVQRDPQDPCMTLLLDRGVYFEFSPMQPDGSWGAPLPLSAIEPGHTYSLIISAPNGLWRYAIGDTVKFDAVAPPRFRIAGRTKSFINAFGEELMEHNAEAAMARTCRETGAQVSDYTAGPVYAASGNRGRHRWLVEFTRRPADLQAFADLLDRNLQKENSDYQAKRAGSIFLDPLELVPVPAGHFARWLATHGNGKLGGQRKIPRLCPTADRLASFEPQASTH